MSGALLDRILEATRTELSQRKNAPPVDGVRSARTPRLFSKTLRRPGALSLIAEVKPKSPSRGAMRKADALDEVLAAYRARAQAVSVLVDSSFFGGGLELLTRVRQTIEQPILAKGFFVDPFQIREVHALGADAVLLIARILDDPSLAELLRLAGELGLDALVETHTDAEVERALAAGASVIGVNARDLDTLRIDLAAARARLARLPREVLRVAESGLDAPTDVEAVRGVADACLIGTRFMNAEDVSSAMEELGW